MRIYAGIAAEDNGNASGMRLSKVLPLQLRGLVVFTQKFRGPAFFAALVGNVRSVVHIHRECNISFLRQTNAFVVDERGMLYRVRACQDGFFDRACAVSMRSHSALR